MPAVIVEEPLGVRCLFSDGSSAGFPLDQLPNPRLARDLAADLAELVHPHGSVDTAGSAGYYARSLRTMVRALAEQDFDGGADDLRRGQAARFWMAGPTHVEAMPRGLVEGFARSGGVLREGVLELAGPDPDKPRGQPAAARGPDRAQRTAGGRGIH